MKVIQQILYAVALVLFLSVAVYCEILNYDDEKCVVDATKPRTEDGNYIDCNTPEKLAENKTKCCKIENDIGCCKNETKMDQMIPIGTSIGVGTVAIMTACFIVFWCNPDTIPCLKRCPCKCCHRGTDEFSSEVTDLSEEIKKAGATNMTFLDRDDHYAPPERYDMPDELRADVQDDWWGYPTKVTTSQL